MKCLKCGGTEHKTNQHGFCYRCVAAIDKEASDIEAWEYLGRWLRNRLEDDGRFADSSLTCTTYDKHQILRLRKEAEAKGVDWRHPSPARRWVDIREDVMVSYGADVPRRGRPEKRRTA